MNAPLRVGDCKILSSRVHDAKDTPAVIFNHAYWPGVVEGHLLRATLTSSNQEEPNSGFLFVVPKDEGSVKPHLQVCWQFPLAVFTYFWVCHFI
jgi:DEP domain-containing protein 5